MKFKLTKSDGLKKGSKKRPDSPQTEATSQQVLQAGAAAVPRIKAFAEQERQQGRTISTALLKEMCIYFARIELNSLEEKEGVNFPEPEVAIEFASLHTEELYVEQTVKTDNRISSLYSIPESPE